LLLGAGISATVGCYVYTRNFDDATEMKQAAIGQVVGTAAFLFARWVVFPVEAAAFIAELDTRTDISEQFPMVSRAMLVSLSLFNLAVTFTIVPKAIRYVIKGFYSPKVSLDELNENELKELEWEVAIARSCEASNIQQSSRSVSSPSRCFTITLPHSSGLSQTSLQAAGQMCSSTSRESSASLSLSH